MAVSFFVIVLLADERPPESKPVFGTKRLGSLGDIGRFLGILFLAVTIITGLAGAQNALTNFSITAFWVVFLLLFTYLTAFFGNLWEFVNPFKTLMDGIEGLMGKKLAPRRAYPTRLGYWPALLSFYGLIWVELVGSGLGTTPHDLVVMIVAYTAVTVAGAYYFGRDAWFTYGELFSVFFGLVSKLSSVRMSEDRFSLRRPLGGLIESQGASFSLMLFIIFMLASTGFDGLKETVAYGNAVELLPDTIGSNAYIVETLGLALAPLVLLAVYLPFVAFMKRLASTDISVPRLAYRFAFSLVPIAVAYHMAHYFTMLLITGQGIIPELSDPFGSGLNLLGTAGYTPHIAFLSASVVWYSEVALIVIGHIGAVYAAHMEALKVFGNRRQALVSQLPMVALMVLYTAGSLWIIAQPIAV